jgi:hypothetical protein
MHPQKLKDFYHEGFFSWSGVEARPLNGLLYQPRMMMDDDQCGAVSRMIGKGNRSILE